MFGVMNGFFGIASMMLLMAVFISLFIRNRPEEYGLTVDNEPIEHTNKEESETKANAEPVLQLSLKQLLTMKDVWLMGIASGAIYIMLVGVVSQIVPRLIQSGYSLNDAIFYMSASALFGTFGAYGWGWLNQRLGVKRAIMVYTVWWMVAIVFNIFADNVVALVISMLMIGFSMPGATNLSTALIASKFPRQYYIRAIGIIHPIQSIIRCCAFSILAFGLAYLGGYTGAYTLFVAIGAITLVLIWMIDTTPVTERITRPEVEDAVIQSH